MENENKMGTMPVGKLLIKMSVPVMISMLVQALYNIVDSVFVAQISEEALTGVTLAFPIQNLMIAISAGTGVGINALVSRRLG
ncbi:MATE family efflux transporter, partial [Jeotgalibaca porci]